MKLALLSDIHSNRQALDACLQHARAHGADHFALLGDLVGYGADPAYVVQQAIGPGRCRLHGDWRQPRRLCRAAPRRNRTRAPTAWPHRRAVDARTTEPRAAQLSGPFAPHRPGRRGAAGAPAPKRPKTGAMLDNEIVAAECLEAATKHPGVQHVFCGHVHQQTLYYRGAGRGLMRFTPTAGVPVPVPPHRQWVGTVGSVGQPRDGDPRAMYALLDTDHWHLRFERVPYAVADAAAAILATGGALPKLCPPPGGRPMKLLEPGAVVDGFVVRDCIHAGGMAHIYRVEYASGAPDPGFPMAMKIPRMTAGDGAENIVGFEVELQLLPASPAPTCRALWLRATCTGCPTSPWNTCRATPCSTGWTRASGPTEELIARLGTALAHAVHSLHQQNACHLDLKPGNVLFTHQNHAVLLDFGLSCHAHFPDLLAEEQRKAVGSPAWMAPEQVVGVRGDPRSDIFAIGVMLYELATASCRLAPPPPRAACASACGWRPPRRASHRPDLGPVAAGNHPALPGTRSRAPLPLGRHLALDLAHPTQVRITERGHRTQGTPFRTHFKRWLRAAGMHYQPSPLPSRQMRRPPSSWWRCRTAM